MPLFAALYWFSGFLQPRCSNPSELSVFCSKLSLHLDVTGKAKGWWIYFSFVCIICSEALWFVTALFQPELEMLSWESIDSVWKGSALAPSSCRFYTLRLKQVVLCSVWHCKLFFSWNSFEIRFTLQGEVRTKPSYHGLNSVTWTWEIKGISLASGASAKPLYKCAWTMTDKLLLGRYYKCEK